MTEMSPTPKKTNGMAITGFVTSFFCGVLGIVFSAIGLSQTGKDPSQGGRGLAIAGLIISIVSLVISFIWWGSLSSAMNNA
jgi:FtsH-binding integral membrane protein